MSLQGLAVYDIQHCDTSFVPADCSVFVNQAQAMTELELLVAKY